MRRAQTGGSEPSSAAKGAKNGRSDADECRKVRKTASLTHISLYKPAAFSYDLDAKTSLGLNVSGRSCEPQQIEGE